METFNSTVINEARHIVSKLAKVDSVAIDLIKAIKVDVGTDDSDTQIIAEMAKQYGVEDGDILKVCHRMRCMIHETNEALVSFFILEGSDPVKKFHITLLSDELTQIRYELKSIMDDDHIDAQKLNMISAELTSFMGRYYDMLATKYSMLMRV
jgi:hypothetical protein